MYCGLPRCDFCHGVKLELGDGRREVVEQEKNRRSSLGRQMGRERGVLYPMPLSCFCFYCTFFSRRYYFLRPAGLLSLGEVPPQLL